MNIFVKNVLSARLSVMLWAGGMLFGSIVYAQSRPNILFFLADDAGAIAGYESYASTVADKFPDYAPGKMVSARTPNINQLAAEGVHFTHAYCSSPSCSPARASILTGQHFWRLEEGGNLRGASTVIPAISGHALDPKFPLYTKLLHEAGYHVGYAGKGYSPAAYKDVSALPAGWTNPAGKKYSVTGDELYLDEFKAFLADRAGKPFCFWVGSNDPHRPFPAGHAGNADIPGIDTAKICVPPYYPVTPEVKNDLADYYWEIQRFDYTLGTIIAYLKSINEYDNTLIVVSSDNGPPFARQKANDYNQGANQPLIVHWKDGVMGGRRIDDFVSLADLAPTFLEAAGIRPPDCMSTQSLVKLLQTPGSGWLDTAEAYRTFAVVGRERHVVSGRSGSRSYPMRAILTKSWTYIHNYDFDLWPAGDPDNFVDVDGGLTKSWMIANRDSQRPIGGQSYNLFDLSFGLRPEEELYLRDSDFWEVNNLAADPRYDSAKVALRDQLSRFLYQTLDPREIGGSNYWDEQWTPTYDRFSPHPILPPQNLSLGKTTLASSRLSAFPGPLAIDSSNQTYWCAARTELPQWLRVDLGEEMTVTRCETRYRYPETAYQYHIEYSLDMQTWHGFADRRTNTTCCGAMYTDTGYARGRYLRITTTACNPADTVAIRSFNIYGSTPTPIRPRSTECNFAQPAGKTTVRLLNIRGQVIDTRELAGIRAETIVPKTAGVYLLDYQVNGKRVIKRLIRPR